MELKTLEGIAVKDILTAFNTAFSDYFVPFQLTERQLRSKMKADNIRLDLSAGTFENGRLVAFILHGFDRINAKRLVYNGGTGVIPKNRGAGLTQRMYSYILPNLRKEGVDRVVLEVIDQNLPAIKSYEKTGFTVTRELLCFKGAFKATALNADIQIKKLPYYNWEKMELFWDIRPTWQNSKNVLEKAKTSLISLGAFLKNELVGYLIYNPESHRIQQIATHKNYRRKGVASTLVTEMNRANGNTLSAINIEKNPPNTATFFKAIGLENYLSQLEMELNITS